jgi:hypothetical protein
MNSVDESKLNSGGEGNPALLEAAPWMARGPIDDTNPLNDGRVIWLIDETCNRRALLHRYEDIRRRESGGKWDGSGYPLVQVDDKAMEALRGHSDPVEDMLDETRTAWEGLVGLIERQFGPHDDVSALVRALASDADTQDAFGSQWPIAQIVRCLNARQAGQVRSADVWNDDRVENAKRRMVRFIAKLRRTHGLDAVDLRALLVRYARESRVAPSAARR